MQHTHGELRKGLLQRPPAVLKVEICNKLRNLKLKEQEAESVDPFYDEAEEDLVHELQIKQPGGSRNRKRAGVARSLNTNQRLRDYEFKDFVPRSLKLRSNMTSCNV